MALVLLSSDLATISRVEGEARRQQAQFLATADPDQAVAHCAEQSASLVLVDLGTSRPDVASLVSRLRNDAGCETAVVAFGPHVHEALLAAAAAAGCDEVLSRGQFFARLGEIIARYAGAAG